MKKYRLVENKEIGSLIHEGNYSLATSLLMKLQREEWRELAYGYDNLSLVKTKSIDFNGFTINLQYNPGRIKSTSVEVDGSTIKKRKCFLCDINLPSKQMGIKILEKYVVLCNPYPVFPGHFTVVSVNHEPQMIEISFKDFIRMSKMLGDTYALIYNGPNCGASAPDHLHFQAGTKHFMPIEDDFQSIKNVYGEIIFKDEGMIVYGVDDGMRKFMTIEAKDEKQLLKTFNVFYETYKKLIDYNEEPMMNLICKYDEEIGWGLIIFIRNKHRSSHYYLKNEDRIMISPAAVDLGGVAITPVEKDFERIDKQLISEIYNEVFITEEKFEQLQTALKKSISNRLF